MDHQKNIKTLLYEVVIHAAFYTSQSRIESLVEPHAFLQDFDVRFVHSLITWSCHRSIRTSTVLETRSSEFAWFVSAHECGSNQYSS